MFETCKTISTGQKLDHNDHHQGTKHREWHLDIVNASGGCSVVVGWINETNDDSMWIRKSELLMTGDRTHHGGQWSGVKSVSSQWCHFLHSSLSCHPPVSGHEEALTGKTHFRGALQAINRLVYQTINSVRWDVTLLPHLYSWLSIVDAGVNSSSFPNCLQD